jgi:2-methylcitrate dehydratase PrpD
MNPHVGFARVLASFATHAPIGGFTTVGRARALDAICDGLGVAVVGTTTETSRAARAALAVPGDAVVIGSTLRFDPATAALVNGTAMHALDFDDLAHPAYAHPTAVILPALLAASVSDDIRGDDVISAYIAGLEVINVLGRYLNMAHYFRGWHATGTLGTLAATAAVARALRLDEDTATTAVSIAASMASGVRANFGTMTKPLHAGLAARNAVQAVALARAGFTAAEDAVGGEVGFVSAFGESDFTPAILREGLSEPWEIDGEIGLALKRFPSCGGTHPGIEAALELREFAQSAAHVRVGVSSAAPEILRYSHPTTGLEGKFSMEYCVAVALLRGAPALGDFTDQAVHELTGSPLFPRIEMVVDARVAESGEFATVIELEQMDGTVRTAIVEQAAGKPNRWLSPEEQRAKFDDCVGVVPAVDGAALWRSARALATDGRLADVANAAGARP